MPNANTIATAPYGFPATGIPLSTSTSELQLKGIPWAACAADEVAILKVDGKMVDKKPFRVKAWGYATGGTTTNLTINLKYSNTTGAVTTVANTKTIATTSTLAVNSESGTWMIAADLMIDSTVKKLQGRYRASVNDGTTVAETATTEVVDAETINTSYALNCDPSTDSMDFTITATWSSGNAANAAYILGFEAQAL